MLALATQIETQILSEGAQRMINLVLSQTRPDSTAKLTQLARWIAVRTGLNTCEVIMVLLELSAAILFFTEQERPVRLPGVGVFNLYVDPEGASEIRFQAAPSLEAGNGLTG